MYEDDEKAARNEKEKNDTAAVKEMYDEKPIHETLNHIHEKIS